MRKFLYLFTLLILLISCKDKKNYTFTNQIVPTPLNVEFGNEVLELKDKIFIVFDNNSTDSEKVIRHLNNLLSKSFSIEQVKEKQKKGTNIFLNIDNNMSPEAYNLTISKNGIEINSGSYKGLFWATQTLRQLFPVEIEKGEKLENPILSYVNISDEPKFEYRGMHLDVCRHFFSVEDVKSYIDILVMHKLNTFHFHLTDDQGWRIDIRSFPKLAEVASQRKETLIQKNWGTYDGIPYGGFYSQDDLKDIVKYAEDRFVTVIPEIEMPGHALAALAAYPELGCTGGPYEVGKYWGVFDDIFCAGKDETFIFLEKVIDEVCELFPNSPYIHIGGDEAPKVRWEKCQNCQNRIIEEGLKNEHELQSYFVQRIEKYVNSKGKLIIGWDEILEGGLAPNATVMSWRGEEGAIAAARQQHNVIMCPTSYCYFDYYQSEDVDNEPFSIGGFVSCEKVYNWNPIPDSLNIEEQKYIIGIQANLWTEYILDKSHLQYMLLPRMAAMAENAWTKSPKGNYQDFKIKLQELFKRYEILGYNFAKHELITQLH